MDAFLVLNAGSSSIKYALYACENGAVVTRGLIDRIGLGPEHHSAGATAPLPVAKDATHGEVLDWLAQRLLQDSADLRIIAAGHRVVHGGMKYDHPIRLTPKIIEDLRTLTPLAPGHQPHNLAGVEAIGAIWPDIPQIACFDTAFHRSQPRVAQLFALPRELAEEGIIRYGFHGLSYDFIAQTMQSVIGARARGRVIVAHLGHGASLCAMVDGVSQATTMGFTALDGLMMGKRCGALDPGVVFHLMRSHDMGAAEVEKLLSKHSGLLGVSGLSDDMRDLLADQSPEAQEAIELFAYRAATQMGAMAAAIGGVDAIIFTGGMGENAAPVRAAILARLTWLGLELDAAANAQNAPRITTDGAVNAYVMATDEEAVILKSLMEGPK